MWAPDPVNLKIAEYTAGYTVKKEGKDAEKLAGRCPEFSRMSLRPPIGGSWAEKYGASLAESEHLVAELGTRGFPTSVRICGKMVPLGRTLCRYLRSGMGYEEPGESEKRSAAWLRAELFSNVEYQERREARRKAGLTRSNVRQRLYPKQESL